MNMSTRVTVQRTPAQERRLAALWKRLSVAEKRTEEVRKKIDRFLNTERLNFVPVSTDD